MFKITIPKPCHEDWAQMTATEQGRHCIVCAKTVVDFTAMSDDEVKHFFINKAEEKVCGRFSSIQLQRVRVNIPEKIFYMPMPLWKRFLVASLLVFGSTLFSCDTGIETNNNIGEIQPITGTMVATPIKKDTVKPKPIDSAKCTPTLGLVAPIVDIKGDVALIPLPDTTKPVVVVPPEMITGGIAPVPAKKDSAKCNTQKYY